MRLLGGVWQEGGPSGGSSRALRVDSVSSELTLMAERFASTPDEVCEDLSTGLVLRFKDHVLEERYRKDAAGRGASLASLDSGAVRTDDQSGPKGCRPVRDDCVFRHAVSLWGAVAVVPRPLGTS